jgi:transcription-repair coupling factor (superfamily II helicase)
MLEEAVISLKAGLAEPVADKWSPQITIGMPVLIPDDYVADLSVRLSLYRRLADLEDEQEIESVAADLVDRFGPLPQEVDHLLKIVTIKALCRRANVEKVDTGPKGAVLSFRDDAFADPMGLVGFIREQGPAAKVRPDMKVVFFDDWEKPEERLKGTTDILRRLVAIAERAKAA